MLVDTSVWVDHFRKNNAELSERLLAGDVWCHPFVIGELACGNLRQRAEVLSLMASLPRVPLAEHNEVLQFVESHELMGSGIGWIDAHLLASTLLAATRIWTVDKRLSEVAASLGILFEP